jgi:hypothetical protein
MSDDRGFITYFRAWDLVKQLAHTNDEIEKDKLIEILWRRHPDAAEELRLPKQPASNLAQSVRGTELAQPKPADATSAESRAIQPGKFCQQVIEEIKRIKNLCVGIGKSIAEIEIDHPDFAVWKVRESLSAEDQEAFNHPNQWGAPVGYARLILSKVKGVSTHTINSWTKAYRKSQRTVDH